MATTQAITTGHRSRRSAVASRSSGVLGARGGTRSTWAGGSGAASMSGLLSGNGRPTRGDYSAVTSAAVTSAALTSAALTSAALARSALTSSAVTAQPQEDEAEDHHGHEPAEVVLPVAAGQGAGQIAEHDQGDHAGDDGAGDQRPAPAPPARADGNAGKAGSGGISGSGTGQRSLRRQVGEQRAQV